MKSVSRSRKQPPASSSTPEKPYRLTPSEIASLRDDLRQTIREAEEFFATEGGRRLFGERGR